MSRAALYCAMSLGSFASGVALMIMPIGPLLRDTRECRGELEEVETKAYTCEMSIEAADKSVMLCTNQLSGLELLLNERHMRVQALEERQAERQAEIDRLLAQEIELRTMIEQRERDNETFKMRLVVVSAARIAAEERLITLNRELTDAKEKVAELVAIIKKLNGSNTTLQSENNDLRFEHEIGRAVELICVAQGLVSVRFQGTYDSCRKAVREKLDQPKYRERFAACPRQGDPWVKQLPRGQAAPKHWVNIQDRLWFAFCDQTIPEGTKFADR